MLSVGHAKERLQELCSHEVARSFSNVVDVGNKVQITSCQVIHDHLEGGYIMLGVWLAQQSRKNIFLPRSLGVFPQNGPQLPNPRGIAAFLLIIAMLILGANRFRISAKQQGLASSSPLASPGYTKQLF